MKKKIVTMLCTLCATMSLCTPVFAADYSTATTAQVPINFSKDSTFTVTLPESISGSSGNTTADFTYTVKGDIASDKHVTLAVTDADSDTEGVQIALTDVAKNTKYATVTMDKTSFAYNEISGAKGKTATGSVAFEGLTAGTWSGNAPFVIGLE